jgi:hypothetical protein
MQTGIERIAKERQEQIEKHGYSTDHDTSVNGNGEIELAVIGLLKQEYGEFPADWNSESIHKMLDKPDIERLVIAGALIAAEIDRLQASTTTPSGEQKGGSANE